ncbi:MAG: CarD family transcriptional regulator, partial [Rikenellaceae bacterium]
MKQQYNIVEAFAGGSSFHELVNSKNDRVLVKGLVGSSLPVAVAGYAEKISGIHIVVMDDKDTAGYVGNDLTELLGEERVLFFPSASKRSALYDGEELSSVVLRTAALSAMAGCKHGETLFICTYPEAISEKVITTSTIQGNSFELKAGTKEKIESIVEILVSYDFNKVDFVYEPGQFSVRGGIVDIFSFSENQPYRIDFFGDEIESIRIFDVSSQRSERKVDHVTIVPYIRVLTDASLRSSLVDFVGELTEVKSTFWLQSPNHIIARLNDIFNKLSAKRADATNVVISGDEFVRSLTDKHIIYLRENIKSLPEERVIEFETSIQPSFNKNFELLAKDMDDNLLRGYKTFILTRNKAQVERLENIFNSIGQRNIKFENIDRTLHGGFIDHQTRCCYYTDHQIFERYHRYKINREIKKSEGIAISELNALSIGDYVVHIDHGVAKFGGLVRSIEAGKSVESVKLLFRDNDILLVNVHSLHKISKFKDKDSESPKLHKLGSSMWQK